MLQLFLEAALLVVLRGLHTQDHWMHTHLPVRECATLESGTMLESGIEVRYDFGYERLVRKYAAVTERAAMARMAPIVFQPTVSGMYRSAAR